MTTPQQADPPSEAQQLADARTATRNAQVRIRELEAQVNALRGENAKARRWARAWKHAAQEERGLAWTLGRDGYVALRAELDRIKALVTLALAYEVEHNGFLGEQQDRLRAALGLPPMEPPPITEAFAALRELAGAAFDGVDVDAFMREVRGDDEARMVVSEELWAAGKDDPDASSV